MNTTAGSATETKGPQLAVAGAADKERKTEVSFARRAFERLGMLPVLVVMYLLFYALTIY